MGDTREIAKIMSQMAIPDVSISLFIISSKQPRLKQLNLDPKLTSQQRKEKLQKWSKENRLAKVITKGDEIFAQVHQDHAHKELTHNGKKIAVEALQDEDYEALQELFDESIQEKSETKAQPVLETVHSGVRQLLAKKMLLSDQTHGDYVLATIRLSLSEIVLTCQRLDSEARREEAAKKKEDEKRDDILRERIKKEILHKEIQTEEIAKS